MNEYRVEESSLHENKAGEMDLGMYVGYKNNIMRAAIIILLVCTLESSAAFTLPVHTYSWKLFQNCYDRAAISNEISRSTTLLRSESTKQTLETDEVRVLFNTRAQCTRINLSKS